MRYWRSLDDLARTPRFLDALQREFPPEATELEIPPVSRRRFLGLVGASSALAGVTLSGCIRKPRQKIMPFAERPEDLVPGRPRFYATSACICGQVEGLLVESHDGRPTKIEGNPGHPMSRGTTSPWAQAEVLSLYDPERSRKPLRRGKAATWGQWESFAAKHFDGLAAARGEGLALLVEQQPSPTLQATLAALADRFPAVRVFRHDLAAWENAAAGAQLAGALGAPLLRLERARILLALDADPLGTEGDTVSNARGFAEARQPDGTPATMNRLYVVEPFFSVTGTMADHRLRLRASQVPGFFAALVRELGGQGLALPDEVNKLVAGAKAPPGVAGKWIPALALDLLGARGRSAIIVGERQPPAVHALALAVNQALDNISAPDAPRPLVCPGPDRTAGTGPLLRPLAELAADVRAGRVKTLLALGGNPVFTAPADLDFAGLLGKVPETIHVGLHVDETAALCSWHLPRSHFLEAWGDWRAKDGTVSIQQPLIAPLFDTRSELEVIAPLAGLKDRRGYELVRAHWARTLRGRPQSQPFDRLWRRWLHDGVAPEASGHAPGGPSSLGKLSSSWPTPAPGDGLELTFRIDPKLFDGRYANNGWLQELPDPVTKLTWDNAVHVGPATAKRLGVTSFDMVELAVAGRSLQLPVFVVPGTADDAAVVTIGNGRTRGGTVLRKAGFDAYRLRTSSAPWIAAGASIKKLGRRYLLASTQDHGSMEGRPLIREAALEEYRRDPGFAKEAVEHPPLRSLWTEHDYTKGHQWGLSVDLNACTGCNACVLACVAENNVPVVGKRRVLEGREMHWVRIDRYFTGEGDDPDAMRVQPMACQQCQLAPCEGVCPVGATAHSPEGLNDMAYNRCIGTRYCSNNCPYKVRRFNFFQYSKGFDAVARMQKNPDVTLRFRGVMEKCTFCVQRINQAKIAAKRDGDGVVPDGTIVPACAQACPTRAIVFGNINDPKSEVSRRKALTRDYSVLAELNLKPRLTYLARLRNPNPRLG